MKNVSDWIQVFMIDGSAIGWIVWLLIVLVTFQAIKALWGLVSSAVRFLLRNRMVVLLKLFHRSGWPTFLTYFILVVATVAWINRDNLNDKWQYLEQVYLVPTYANTDTSAWTLGCYESECRRWVSESEFRIIQQKMSEISAAIGCTPLSIYEVAYSECGLNPFAANVSKVTGDTVAFGWIQFTNAGCKGLEVGGSPVTMSRVKSWGRSRNVAEMMEATKAYLVDRAKGRQLPTATDIYICVFAPGFLGCPDDQALYSLATWPKAYRENIGLDGYGIIDGKVVKLQRFMDGKITRGDMTMHLVMKRSKFLGKQQLKPQNL